MKPTKSTLCWSVFWISLLTSGSWVAWMSQNEAVVAVPPRPGSHRLISLSPNVTELIIALGAVDRLVGVSDYCHPPLTKNLPACGGLLNPNFERIMALHPSRIFLLGKMEYISQFASLRGIETTSVNVDSFSDLVAETRRLGILLDVSDKAEALVARMSSRLEAVRGKASKRTPLRCLLLMGRDEGGLNRMMVIGGPSYISEMLGVAGGRNVFASNQRGYFYASLEAIKALEPEVVFELREGSHLSAFEKEKLRKDWAGQHSLPAVQTGRIIICDDEVFGVPGPRMPEIAEIFQKHLESMMDDSIRAGRTP